MKAALERAKELEVARLWATQKRLVDRASEIDELRARRCAQRHPDRYQILPTSLTASLLT